MLYLIEVDFLINLQLLVKVLAVGSHPLTELKPPLDVGGVNEVVHVQQVALANSCCFTELQHLHGAHSR